MCGLAGIARLDGAALQERLRVLDAMACALSHRGPDDIRLLHDERVGLAFTRLSIVDAAGGGQPLSSEDESVVLIANGEIYNHRELEATLPSGTRLKTRSDCEVLIHLYQRDGRRFLDDVRGIYAVVVWDRRRGRVVLARDRFGIKPLYYHRNRERVVFGSEIKALFADGQCPRRLDWKACLLDQLVTAEPMLDDRSPTTWFEEIESVPAGSVVEVDTGTGELCEHRYWRLPRPGGDLACSPAELARTYRDLLQASVVESGMSDAEIGLFLSGGLDSAAVAAFSAGVGGLHTFTALNAGTFANEDSRYAHRVAAALGLPNHQVLFGPERVPSPDEWKRLVWLLETPLCGPEQFYKFEMHRFARATRPNLKVMLLGQASDEFNGGYSAELAGGGGWGDFSANLRTMARRRALLDCPRLASWWEHPFPLLTDEALQHCAGRAVDDPYAAFVAAKYRDIQQYNCWHEDRTAAGNGIEARVPFLDHRIVELTATIPHAQRERLLWNKRLLREALAGVLPADCIARPKVGFFYGPRVQDVYRTFGRMLSRHGGALLEEALAGPVAGRFVDRDAARATLHRLELGAGGHVEFLLRLVNLGLLEQMIADLPAPPAERPPQPRPEELVIADWDAEREGIEAAVLERPRLSSDVVPAFADGVMLVRAEPAGDVCFLLVDSRLEYVIDAEEDRDWLGFLRAVDGRRDVGEILAITGCTRERVAGLLREAFESRVLVAAAPALESQLR